MPDNLTSLPDGDGQGLQVVGESKYQDALRFIARGRVAGYDLDEHLPARALLVPEPDNKWDANAVRVDLIMGKRTYEVGYLPRHLAEMYQPELLYLDRAGSTGTCRAYVTGGGDKLYGVYLHLALVRDLRPFLRDKFPDVAGKPDSPAVAGTPLPENLVPLPDGDKRRVAVVGENLYQDAFRFVAGGQVAGEDDDEHLPARVLLVPEPTNQWDRHAVRIDLIKDGHAYKVGYIPRRHAAEYQPDLLLLERAGLAGTCQAYISGGGDDEGGYEIDYGVYLHLAGPSDLRLFLRREVGVIAEERDGLALLCADVSCAVTKVAQHQDTLRRHAPKPRARSREVVATLAFCDITTGKYKGEKAIEVRIDGDRVGQLGRPMSSRYAEVVSGILDRGLTPACTAHVADSDKGLQVTLSVPDGRLYT